MLNIRYVRVLLNNCFIMHHPWSNKQQCPRSIHNVQLFLQSRLYLACDGNVTPPPPRSAPHRHPIPPLPLPVRLVVVFSRGNRARRDEKLHRGSAQESIGGAYLAAPVAYFCAIECYRVLCCWCVCSVALLSCDVCVSWPAVLVPCCAVL